MTTTATKPLTPRQIEALRYLAAHPSNPVYPDGVQAGTLALLRRRGLVGKHKPNRRTQTTSPLTDAGRALLAALDSAAFYPPDGSTPPGPDDAALMAQAARERAWPLGECYEACGREAVHLDERAGALSVPYCDECLPRGEALPHV